MERQGTGNPSGRLPARRPLRWLRVSGLAVFGLLMTLGQLLPGGKDAPGGWDAPLSGPVQNALHVPAYLILCLLALEATADSGLLGRSLVVAACLVHGGVCEWLQAMAIPGRFGSWADMGLNVLGVAGGCTLWAIWRLWRGRACTAAGEARA